MAPVPGDSPKTPVWHVDAARGPSTPSFDHLVSAQQDPSRQLDSNRFGGLEVDDELKFRRLLDRQIASLRTFENFGYVISGPAIHQHEIDPVRHQPASADVVL